jgi:LacI family transcriptional regulator
MDGYRQFAEAHSDVTVTLQEIENDRIDTGYALVERIRGSETPIDGVFAGSDEMAAGVLQAAREADISVPDELRVLGFDDQPISEILGISTVRQPIEKMGSMAAEQLMEHVEARDRKKAERYRVKYRLIQRETT